MDKCSYFIDNKALFGSYPEQKFVDELEEDNVILFVNLTCPSENLNVYTTKNAEIINFPIKDRSIPKNYNLFSKLIVNICNKLKKFKKDEKIYVHCKGGHGRAGIVVASILTYLYSIPPDRALCLTTEYHSNRKNMRMKWRQIGSPQTNVQKTFVLKFFSPLYYYKSYKGGLSEGFSTFSNHSVTIKNKGTFHNAEAAFQSFKDENNSEYVNKLLLCSDPYLAKELGKKCILRNDWFDVRDDIMYNIMKMKIIQHPELTQNLLNTKLRPIIENNKRDMHNPNFRTSGVNKSGRILNKIREELLLSN